MSNPGTRPQVLLTGPMDSEGTRRIAERAEVVVAPDARPETLRRLVATADVLVVRSALPVDLFDHAPRLIGVVRHGVGVDMIPMEAANARRLPVANVPGSNHHAVAEHAIGALALLRRRTAAMDATLRSEGWGASRRLSDDAVELHGQVLGIVGLGSIGTRIAEIAHHGYGMQVLGHQRALSRVPPFVEGVELDRLLARSDAVVLACPLTEATRGLLDARRLALMPAHAVLVNVARGEIVDEDALVDALRQGRLAGAALDVFKAQPLPPDHPLLTLQNVLLTPHAAGLTLQSMRRMSAGTADAVLRLLAGQRPQHLVNEWPPGRFTQGL